VPFLTTRAEPPGPIGGLLNARSRAADALARKDFHDAVEFGQMHGRAPPRSTGGSYWVDDSGSGSPMKLYGRKAEQHRTPTNVESAPIASERAIAARVLGVESARLSVGLEVRVDRVRDRARDDASARERGAGPCAAESSRRCAPHAAERTPPSRRSRAPVPATTRKSPRARCLLAQHQRGAEKASYRAGMTPANLVGAKKGAANSSLRARLTGLSLKFRGLPC
jgi:hypothetical protein